MLLAYAAELEEQIDASQQNQVRYERNTGVLRMMQVLLKQHQTASRAALNRWRSFALHGQAGDASRRAQQDLANAHRELESSRRNLIAS